MGTIEEVFDDIKDTFSGKGGKNNGLLIFGIGFVVVFIIALLKDSGGSSEGYSVATSYASYPDAVTNANVIIDSLQNSIAYSEQEIKDHVDDRFQATNDFISEGLAKQEELSNKIYDSSMNSFEELKTQIGVVDNKVDTVTNKVNTITTNVANLDKKVSGIDTTTKNIQKTVTSSKSSTTSTSVGTTKSNTKYMSTKYKGNSIVDGLKAGGYNSSYAYRKQLAQANGITGYTGSASQNTKLLNLLKQGKLKSA